MPRAAKTLHATPPAPRESGAARGYDWFWRKLRAAFLARNPMCVACAGRGVSTPATHVDHIVPMAEGGHRYDEANLQPLCHSCHSRKTVATDGGFGRDRHHAAPRLGSEQATRSRGESR